ncbi:MAG: hypothetical protein ACR2GZ_07235 [Solirubrobacteraceae bacterium]
MPTGSDDAPEASTAPSEAASDGASPDAPAAEAPKRKPQVTARERAERKREEKLENVREEVKAGSLVIRQMTDEERALYPPRENAPRSKRFGGR